MLRAVRAIEPVVGGHQPPRTALFHGEFERQESHFAQGALVHARVDRVAFELAVVADEVLGRHGDTLRLDPTDKASGDLSGQQRILAVTLEVSAPLGRAMQVDRRCQQDVRAFGPRFLTEEHAKRLDQFGVPCRPQRGARWDTGRWRAGAHQAVTAGTVGAVGHLQRRDTESVNRGGVPHVGSGYEQGLFVGGHLVSQGDSAFRHAATLSPSHLTELR